MLVPWVWILGLAAAIVAMAVSAKVRQAWLLHNEFEADMAAKDLARRQSGGATTDDR